MVASGKEPDTGAVTGDTWKDFQRTYRRSGPRIYCIVVASGDAEPIEGSVYQEGVVKPAFLSVAGIPTIQRTLRPAANGLIIDLELTLFSLLLPELDGIPVAQHVRSVDVASGSVPSVDAAPLLTFGDEYSCWPKLANVPSFDGDDKINKDLCVGQIIGLLQFRQVPRHPRKECRATDWFVYL